VSQLSSEVQVLKFDTKKTTNVYNTCPRLLAIDQYMKLKACIHAWYVSKRQLIDLYMKLKARIHSIQYVEGTYITDQ